MEEGGLDISNNRGSGAVGYVVRSECDFLKSIQFLEEVKVASGRRGVKNRHSNTGKVYLTFFFSAG